MKQDHIFFDIETSSLDYKTAEIIDMAAVRTDRKGNVLEAFSTKVMPQGEVDIGAANKNNYDPEEWANAPKFKDALSFLTGRVLSGKYMDKYVVVAHFAEFDKTILTNQCERAGIEVAFHQRAWLDTAQIAWPLVFNDMLPGRSLDILCKYYGVVNDAPHTAAGDASALATVYWIMMRRLSTVVMAEEYIAEIGGVKLDKIRKMVGL